MLGCVRSRMTEWVRSRACKRAHVCLHGLNGLTIAMASITKATNCQSNIVLETKSYIYQPLINIDIQALIDCQPCLHGKCICLNFIRLLSL